MYLPLNRDNNRNPVSIMYVHPFHITVRVGGGGACLTVPVCPTRSSEGHLEKDLFPLFNLSSLLLIFRLSPKLDVGQHQKDSVSKPKVDEGGLMVLKLAKELISAHPSTGACPQCPGPWAAAPGKVPQVLVLGPHTHPPLLPSPSGSARPCQQPSGKAKLAEA